MTWIELPDGSLIRYENLSKLRIEQSNETRTWGIWTMNDNSFIHEIAQIETKTPETLLKRFIALVHVSDSFLSQEVMQKELNDYYQNDDNDLGDNDVTRRWTLYNEMKDMIADLRGELRSAREKDAT